jgi:hypothetical protein
MSWFCVNGASDCRRRLVVDGRLNKRFPEIDSAVYPFGKLGICLSSDYSRVIAAAL